METIRLFVVDDHKLFVEGIVSLLSDEPGFTVVGSALSGQDFLEVFGILEVDVYLMDINMPGMSGIELTQKIREARPDARILVLTMYDDIEYVEKLVRSGASGYVLKSANIQELTGAIRIVATGNKYFGQEIQDLIFSKMGRADRQPEQENPSQSDAHLTRRELEVLTLIAQEYSTREIAEKLFISERTVETHRKNILSKTNAKSAVGLSKYAIQRGLIRLE